MANILALK